MQLTDSQTTAGALVVSEMRRMYGAKFGQQWQGLTPRELKDSWDRTLAGLTEAEIRTGLLACLSRDWPPTLPEFLRLCRPWLNPEVAYHEAVQGISCRRRGEIGHWSHPAIYWAAVSTGTHDLLNSTYSTIKVRWEREFAKELEKGTWPSIPEVREALPGPGQTMSTKEEAAAALKRMGVAEIKPLAQGNKAWAEKILAEHERKGGQRYSASVLAMAKRALGIELNAGEAV
ncbi:hypothetical protein [Bordetella sp. 02P26C-1]|uniref:hypothetical protein n=1 Tax=Bordetella sp. 02P26C-1 TaxID=2683195 RepID=UPI001355CA42|nr:hypothetical protein [Bordetella sp. 02P26C-1]MVW80196.1 hypothetical protein [Bordetella sp. 02P26C-1]